MSLTGILLPTATETERFGSKQRSDPGVLLRA